MPRGVRKSQLEKLQLELTDVQASIQQYENCLETLRGKAEELKQRIDLEEFKSVQTLLDERGMSLDDLKDMLEANVSISDNTEEQSA